MKRRACHAKKFKKQLRTTAQSEEKKEARPWTTEATLKTCHLPANPGAQFPLKGHHCSVALDRSIRVSKLEGGWTQPEQKWTWRALPKAFRLLDWLRGWRLVGFDGVHDLRNLARKQTEAWMNEFDRKDVGERTLFRVPKQVSITSSQESTENEENVVSACSSWIQS